MARKAAVSAPSPGLDRRRVGERLEASLAGLQELRLLREKQRETVQRVLGAQEEEEEEEDEATGDRGKSSPGGFHQPARATGNSQQLFSLGTDETGGRQQRDLDHHVADLRLGSSEAQLPLGLRCAEPEPLSHAAADPSRPGAAGGPGEPLRGVSGGIARAPGPPRGVRCAPTEPPGGSGELKRSASGTQLAEGPLDNPDSDSRPSSGFYDVSDSTSCSLSNSCTSVYSECPSGSRWSMQSLSQLPRPNCHWNRPRSTDDSAVRLMDLRSQRLLLCGQGIQADEDCGPSGADRRSKVAQRPVSTGDLNLLRRCLSVDPRGGPLSCYRGDWGPRGAPDAKYQCDLVSRNGTEVYHYPSPLHAVALQSPLFTAPSPRGCPSQEDDLGGATWASKVAGPSPAPATLLPASRGRLDKYISGLVLRFRCRPAPGKSELASHAKSLSMSSVYSQSSSTLGGGAAPLVSPAGGWKLRRRISTCCQAADRARSPEGAQSHHSNSNSSSSEASSPSSETCRLSEPLGLGPSCPPEAPLYLGKHLHRELVKCPPADEGGPRPGAGGRKSGSRSRSEMNLNLAGCQRPEASPPCGLECRPSPAKRRQRKWTSVLEIPGPASSAGSRCRPRKPGFLGQAQAFLSRRHRAFSADSPPSGALEASREDLWACRCRGDAGPCQARDWARGAETLPRPAAAAAAAAAADTRFHRSKSFKELRKKVQLSIRPWSLKVNNSSK
ncbi:dapper homolog 2-like [Carcharodon carcharias]|uniref:dapper homolog 2-like n=1 Tax=Carcharodon carcharias TaxID=13397 RepID=UPI001B7F3FE6|nr:dapper homolog 2-like [Carcharodon carcharias]